MKKTIAIMLAMFTLLTALVCAHAQAAIDEAAARTAALEHAALTENDVTALTVKRDREDGREVYEVEFSKETTEYDYDVDAASGEIVAFDIETRGAALPHFSEAAITPEAALKAALDKAGVAETNATNVETSLKFKNAAAKYKIEFVAGGAEYEVEIDATNGAILEYDVETVDD